MSIKIRPVEAADITQFVEWHYQPPYSEYDLSLPLEEALQYFLDPAIGCHAIDLEDDLVGFCTLGKDAQVPGGDYRSPALDIGMGIKPEFTGRGLGTTFVAAVVDFVGDNFEVATLRVTIAAPNTRAAKVWMANGFTEVQQFQASKEILGTTEFVVWDRQLAR